MPIVEIKPVGQVGINRDLSTHELPAQAWTDGNNIRFLDGYAGKVYGYDQIYTPSVTPYHILPVSVGGTRYWVYAGTGKVYCVNGTTHTDLTRSSGGDYTGAVNKWTSTTIAGIPVINDGSGANYPQSWDLNIANKFGNLANWTANTYCKSIRTYKSYLVALNITKTTTNYPYMVKWSHPADPGAVPVSWDITDSTKDAGEIDLAEGGDAIVDGLALRDSFLIYKENSIWRMDFIGGVYVHKFQKVLGSGGALSVNCVAEIDGMHFVMGSNDVYVHDGVSPKSVLDKATRRYLFANIDANNYKNTFVAKNPFFNEVMVCYPSLGNSIPNKAMVWNYNDNTTSFRDIPNLYHASSGLVESGIFASTWETDSGLWGDDLTLWNGGDAVPDGVRFLGASSANKIYMFDSSASFDGSEPDAYIERRGLSFDAPQQHKVIRGIRPRITGTQGETVTVKVGYQDEPYIDPIWVAEMDYVIGSTVACDCMVDGRYIAIRFESGTAAQWRLDSYDIDVELGGTW